MAIGDGGTAIQILLRKRFMNLQARPLTEFVGAEIIGIDLAKPIDEETKARLYLYLRP